MKVLFLFALLLHLATSAYSPTWESLDARPLPSWYDESKFGIFIHWGVFSVPAFSCGDVAAEWYWWGLDGSPPTPCIVEFHNKTYGPNFKYADFASSFNGNTFFNANEWASLFASSGAKYVVLISKHHEGYTNWPSPEAWNWNSVDVGAHQDTVGLLSQAVKAKGLHMGLYYSLFEWFNPLYLKDRANGGATQTYVNEIMMPQLMDIVNTYQPEIIWSDGDWEMNDTYWDSKQFLAWLYNSSPVNNTVCVNDRWGAGDTCKHGGYWTCQDRYNPHELVNHKWENCMTIDYSTWGFARNHNISYYLSTQELLNSLISTVAYGGNLLLNVGPTHDGRIVPIFEDRLLAMGSWLQVNGEGIYSTHPWRAQNESNGQIYYTFKTPTIYAFVMSWPTNNIVKLTNPIPTPSATVQLVGYSGPNLSWSSLSPTGIAITLPNIPVSLLPSQYVWTLRLSGFK